MPNLPVYNLGEKGVVLTKAPVHNEDGELSSAQNAIIDSNAREGSLRKRSGLTALNSVAAAGTIRSMTHVPFTDVSDLTRTLYASIDASVTANTNTWRTSTNGTTWTNATTPARALEVDQGSGFFTNLEERDFFRAATYAGVLYYPADGYVRRTDLPPVRIYDGSLDAQLLVVPQTPSGIAEQDDFVAPIIAANTFIYFGATVVNGANSIWRVFQYSPTTGHTKRVGEEVSETGLVAVSGLVWHNNRLYACTARGGSSGRVLSIRPPQGDFAGDSTWTVERAIVSGISYTGMAVFNGEIYLTTSNSAAPGTETSKVLRRTNLNVYSTSDDGVTDVTLSLYSSPVVYSGALYATRRAVTSNTFIIRRFDGTTWTTDQNILTLLTGTSRSGQPVVRGSELFLSIPITGATGGILRRSGGTWTAVDTSIAFGCCLANLDT